MRKLVIIGGIVGIGIVVWLIISEDWQKIFQSLQAFSWKIVPVTVWYFFPLAVDTAAWRILYLRENRPGWLRMYWARWVSMGLNTLLPTGQVGGHVVSARMVTKSRYTDQPAVVHAATVTADVTIGMVAQGLYTLMAVILLYPYAGGSGGSWTFWAGMGVIAAVAALLIILQRRGMFGGLAGVLKKISAKEQVKTLKGKADELDRKISEIYSRRRKVARCGLYRFIGWVLKSGESYLALYFLGYDVTIMGAIIIEAIALAVMKAAFFLPGGIGAREGAILMVGTYMGIPQHTALAFAIIKRIREIIFGVPAILSWLGYEGRLHFPKISSRESA